MEMDEYSQKESIHNQTERQERIAKYLLQHPSVRVQDLVEQFNVSAMTVHRDLDELERQGILRKVRGGATAEPSSLFEADMRFRMGGANLEKKAIARYALQYIEVGQAVMMDDSTTTLALADLLTQVTPITVITNSMAIIQRLSEVKEVRLISLGGEYVQRYGAFTGMVCEQAINSLRANVLVMSTSAISDNIAFHQEQDIVKVKQAMMRSSALKILMVDHTKLNKIALHRLAPLEEFDRVIVDSGVDKQTLAQLENAHIKVEIAQI
jgi:DeoR/GlpR family transcriptional regulator of sugar metabolism